MRHERKITREYDYRQNGAYAVTICVYGRRLAFGRVENGGVRLHPFGQIAQSDWLAIPTHYSQVVLDEFIVMPNHFHGILWIEGEPPPTVEEERKLREFGTAQSDSLGAIIGNYKSGVTRQIGERRGNKTRVWQPRFFDHIIRNDRDLELQRKYIRNNPSKWADDELNPHGS